MAEAHLVIKWKCDSCGAVNISGDSLEENEVPGVREDNIMCDSCGEDNHVTIEE